MSDKVIYESPDGLPRLQCPDCNNSDWILHEHEIGKDSVVHCSVCGFRAAIGIRGTASAGHVLSDDEAALLGGVGTGAAAE